MSSLVLEIQNLCLSGRSTGETILNNISLDIRRKKITGIVGESGSGKSMTALSILGLLPPGIRKDKGDIVFYPAGSNPVGLEDMNRNRQDFNGKKISMIFQEPMTSLNPSMRCGTQVDEVIRKHLGGSPRERKDKILTLFEKVKLPGPKDIYTSYPHQLSGGQRQRIMIAMAVATRPEILIADEPTTALDIRIQRNIIELLKELQEEMGLSVIFISHDLRIIREIADEAVVMRHGSIVESAPANKLFNSPEQPYTKGLLACLPPLDSRPYRLITIEEYEKGNPDPLPKPSEKYPKPEKNPVLEILDLSILYPSSGGFLQRKKKPFPAVSNVSFQLYQNETLGLVGESGSGKTTLGKSILKLIQLSSGQIRYKGKNIADFTYRELKLFRKNVQVVFQDPYSSLNPKMTVRTLLSEARKLHFPGEGKEERLHKLIGLLEKTGLRDTDLDKYPHEFSGGQRQRIGISRSLCTEPEIIILDEAVSALDVSVQAQILNLLNNLKTEFGLGYIFISHDLSVVKYMSDRMIVLKDGKIEEEGEPVRIFRDPSSGYTRRLIESLPGI